MRRPTNIRLAAAAAAVVLLWTPQVRAHLGNISNVEIDIRGTQALLRVKFAAHLIPGTPQEGQLDRRAVLAREHDILEWFSRTVTFETASGRCTPELVDLVGPDQNDDLEVGFGFGCPSPAADARIEFHAFDDSLPGYRSIVAVRTGDSTAAFVFTRETPVLVIGSFAAEQPQHSRFREFFALGVEHIWTGYDHLLFLLALLLPGGTIGRLAGIVTAFTIAHSITLARAALLAWPFGAR